MNAQELCMQIVASIQGDKSEVRNIVDADSPVEHEVDYDVLRDGIWYNVTVNVRRFGKV
jgi:hypothetical protein